MGVNKFLFFILLGVFFCFHINAEFANDPIDVIIPCTEKDLETLDFCIEGIRANCSQVRRVIVISDRCLTDKAEWFDEKLYPFGKEDVAYFLLKCDPKKAQEFLRSGKSRVGWYLQQLLKLYAVYVIPGISQNILCLDADTIFLKPVHFFDSSGNALYNPSTEHYAPYFEHISNLVPGLKRIYPEHSGISHHMLMQKNMLDDLVKAIEDHHSMEAWKAFCFCVKERDLYGSGASEYELYFNFLFSKENRSRIRMLNWTNLNSLEECELSKRGRFYYVSYHYYLR